VCADLLNSFDSEGACWVSFSLSVFPPQQIKVQVHYPVAQVADLSLPSLLPCRIMSAAASSAFAFAVLEFWHVPA